VAACLSLPRVLALMGGLALLLAFFMPWFSSQGLLLSGQFLEAFLSSASPTDLRRFLPSSSPTEVQMLRTLVGLFPACGAIAMVAALVGGLVPSTRTIANVVLGLSGLIPLAGWAVGVSRLPVGSNPEIGLSLILAGSLAIVVGLALDATRAARAGAARAGVGVPG
jgi:hypothetical protein